MQAGDTELIKACPPLLNRVQTFVEFNLDFLSLEASLGEPGRDVAGREVTGRDVAGGETWRGETWWG